MTDKFDRLGDAMRSATPAPDEERRAANLRLAQENFRKLQGSPAAARPSQERAGFARLLDGVRPMLNIVTTKGGLAATTALVAVAAVLVLNDAGGVLKPPLEPNVVSELDSAALRKEAASDDAVAPEPAPAAPTEAEGIVSQIADAPSVLALEENTARSRAPLTNGIIVPQPADAMAPDTEAFANADTNPLKVTATDPVSTFSIDVDTASWSVVRSSLMGGALPPRDAVRVEEMVNYFPYTYPEPEGPHPFEPTVRVVETPWNPDTQLIHIGIQGTLPAHDSRAPLNLVFLIDTSGSMQDTNKLPLLRQSFRLMLSELHAQDQVAIVTYAGSAGQVLAPTPAGERETIIAALERLEAGGSTAGQAGLEQAYATAEAMAEDGEVTRVILATDGDFNVGLSDPSALEDYIADKRDSGTYLSVLGFGRGNLDDATMQALAQNGNGQAAYIDTLSEARKVLVDQLTGALFPIANDVKIQVEFNPAEVAEYRLIGYETRALNREDFNNDAVDAGDIGAGHTVTALYEITPVGSPAQLTDPLRYQPADLPTENGELAFLKLRYKAPGETDSVLIETPVTGEAQAPTGDVAFSAAIAGFGQLLRGGDHLGDWTYADAIALANAARGDDPYGYRSEAVTLMRLAESLAR